LDVGDIGMAQVLDVLEPIWRTKTETASRVRGRIERILSWADKRAERERLNPARWRGHLDTQLPAPTKVRKPKHHAALPVSQVGSFLSSLRGQEGTAARALEFVILTAARSGEVRFATWPEIDFKSRTWTVPAKRMKSGREHRVPLSAAAISLLESIPLVDGSEVIFQGATRRGALRHNTGRSSSSNGASALSIRATGWSRPLLRLAWPEACANGPLPSGNGSAPPSSAAHRR